MSIEQIQGLVDALAARLGRAVIVDDQDLRLIAVSEDFGDADHRFSAPRSVGVRDLSRMGVDQILAARLPQAVPRDLAGGTQR
jgi:hypothetical protein